MRSTTPLMLPSVELSFSALKNKIRQSKRTSRRRKTRAYLASRHAANMVPNSKALGKTMVSELWSMTPMLSLSYWPLANNFKKKSLRSIPTGAIAVLVPRCVNWNIFLLTKVILKLDLKLHSGQTWSDHGLAHEGQVAYHLIGSSRRARWRLSRLFCILIGSYWRKTIMLVRTSHKLENSST